MRTKKLLLSITFIGVANLLLPIVSCFSQGTWTQKADFGATARRQAVGFSINGKGYIGTGNNASVRYKDFWEYDTTSNAWTQKADVGTVGRHVAVGFSIGSKGYIGTGYDGTSYRNDFWEYNPSANTWIQKANFGGAIRGGAVGFSIGTKGYIGTGFNTISNIYNDFWQYDPSSDTWTQKANFGGTPRYTAVGFSTTTKGYIGTGVEGASTLKKDFWEYNPVSDTWIQKTNFGGTARKEAVAFEIGNKGYVGTGNDGIAPFYKNDIWEYNPVNDSWTQKASFAGTQRQLATGISVGNRGYIGTGYDGVYKNDFWEYDPSLSSCNISLNVTATNSSCGQPSGTATVVATGGNGPYTYAWTNGDKTNTADSLAANLYMVLVTDASGCTAQAPAMINDAGAPVISVTNVNHVLCNGGNNGAISISVTGGSGSYSYFWANGNTNQNMSNLQAGPHQIQVTDGSGCMATKIVFVNEPAPLVLADSIKNASCGNPDGAAWVFASGGTQPYSYLWSTGATTSSVSNLAAGSYSAMVTDNKGCKKSGMGTIVNLGAATAVIDSFIPAACSSGVGSVYISVSGGSPPYTYAWTNGATTQDLVNVPPGNYGLTIYSNGNPCTGAFSGTLPWKTPYTPAICIVTVDTITGKNQCVFVKDSIAAIGLKQYNFYRETTSAGVYQKLGSKPANQVSLWTDQSANPLQHAWRYKITSEDSCGNQAPISGYHKTIHLTANIGVSGHVNLIWDDYEGFAYTTFIIYRFTWATGWDSLDAVPSNLHSYTDLSISAPFTDVYYYVAVSNPSGCEVNGINPQPESANLNLSKSNINKIGATPTGIQPTYTTPAAVVVHPNPTTGMFQVQSSRFKTGKAEVMDVMGRPVFSKNMDNGILNMDLSAEPNGIYFLKIVSEEGTVTKKIIVQ